MNIRQARKGDQIGPQAFTDQSAIESEVLVQTELTVSYRTAYSDIGKGGMSLESRHLVCIRLRTIHLLLYTVNSLFEVIVNSRH